LLRRIVIPKAIFPGRNSGFAVEKNPENQDLQKPVSNFGNMKFSSPQKMASENPKRQGYIAPIGMGGANQGGSVNLSQANPKIKGNVVDLRN
jgi:hypothetical protein